MTLAVIVFALSREGWSVLFWVAVHGSKVTRVQARIA
jgi:hypothetical protein